MESPIIFRGRVPKTVELGMEESDSEQNTGDEELKYGTILTVFFRLLIVVEKK